MFETSCYTVIVTDIGKMWRKEFSLPKVNIGIWSTEASRSASFCDETSDSIFSAVYVKYIVTRGKNFLFFFKSSLTFPFESWKKLSLLYLTGSPQWSIYSRGFLWSIHDNDPTSVHKCFLRDWRFHQQYYCNLRTSCGWMLHYLSNYLSWQDYYRISDN